MGLYHLLRWDHGVGNLAFRRCSLLFYIYLSLLEVTFVTLIIPQRAGLSEGDKVERVLDKFHATPASGAQDGALQKLVGRVVVAGQSPFFSPATGKPCVYFDLVIEEE